MGPALVYDEANTACNNKNAKLAEPTNVQENEAISNFAGHRAWIGIVKDPSGNMYVTFSRYFETLIVT